MTCQDRDPDLLLFELGELSFWQRRRTAHHLRGCTRCRARQRELAAASNHFATALRPPMDGGGGGASGTRARVPVRPAWLGLSPWLLLVVMSVAVLSVLTVSAWYRRAHPAPQRIVSDDGCAPGIPSDRCR